MEENLKGASGEREGSAATENIRAATAGDNNENSVHDATQKRRRLPKALRRQLYPNWVDILAIVGIIIVSQLAGGLVSILLRNVAALDPALVTALGYFVQMTLAIVFVLLQRKGRNINTNVIKLGASHVNAPLILWGVVLIFATGMVIEPLLALFPAEYMQMLDQGIGSGGWAIFMTVLLAPVMEEVLFRGLIQGSIEERDGAVKAIFIAALIFGLVHFIPQQAINAFFVGIILGYIYYRTRSLLTVMLLHALNNGIAYLQMELLGGAAGGFTTRELIGNDNIYYIIYGLSVLLFVIGAVAIFRRLKTGSEQSADSLPAKDSVTDNN